MPLARSRVAATGSTADSTEANTATGASVRAATSIIASGKAVSPSNSRTRSTASAVTATAGSAAQMPKQLVNNSRVSAPVPHRSNGLVATNPSSSRSPIAPSAASPNSANSTPRSCARSAHNARSAPESCTVAIPREPGRRRRPASKSSIVSHNSDMSRTRTAPVCAQNACQPTSSPASAPEWAATIARPRGECPTDRITTGTSCSAARRRAARSRRAARGVSSSSAISVVWGSSSA